MKKHITETTTKGWFNKTIITREYDVFIHDQAEEVCDHFWKYSKDEKKRRCALCNLRQQWSNRTKVLQYNVYGPNIANGYWFNLDK